ncbi:hypothetical protein V492_05553 [Pseudogymnoascus sp. VKM F-4246]|nr:hypothetical protein V492_05553 [Pseudogymnoascus sp. VKM F-4246]
MDSTTTDASSTNHPTDTTSLILVWILCVSIVFFLCINAWAIRFIRRRTRDQEALPANPERAESPAREFMMTTLRTQGQPGPSQLGYPLQALSSSSMPRISSPEQITVMRRDSLNDIERRDGRHSVDAGNMASFSYTASETEEQLPKYMERDHDLPDYAGQSERPSA